MKKSQEEIKFDTVCEQYEAMFGKSYGINMFDPRSLEDHIKVMEDAMREGEPAVIPELDPSVEI
jgi:hypothetical protein